MLNLFYWKEDRDVLLFLTGQHLINSSLEELKTGPILKKSSEIFFAPNTSSFKILEACNRFEGSQTTVQLLYKFMVFLHCVLQAMGQKVDDGVIDLLLNKLNETLGSIDSLLYQKKTCLNSKQLIFNEDAQSQKWKIISNNSFIESLDETEFTAKQIFKTADGIQNSQQQEQYCASLDESMGKRQFLTDRIIRPYAAYLQKLITWRTHFYQELTQKERQNLNLNQVWAMLNLFRSMAKITLSFFPSLRYFGDTFKGLIITLTELFDREICQNYCKVIQTLKNKVQMISEKYQMITNQEPPEIKHKKLKQLEEQYELRNLREIVKEVISLNDFLFKMYKNKYIIKRLREKQIIPPNEVRPDNQQYEVIFGIIDMIELEEKMRKKELRASQRLASPCLRKSNTLSYGGYNKKQTDGDEGFELRKSAPANYS